ncbi:MAG: hypothetical protein C0608_10785 [Deltaproteobacteria bacterium]|nr:MAG: hypothetical protein C0608_10785 [Deltaproteobacteria bacterium]
MKTFIVSAIIFFLAALISPHSYGGIYKWVDKRGVVHFTDEPMEIPRQETLSTAEVELYGGRYGNAEDNIPLERASAGYLVDAIINDAVTVRLIVDTGATSTVISPERLIAAGLVVKTEPAVIVTTAGGKVNAGWAMVSKLDVGGRPGHNLRVVAMDPIEGADGLLGMDFMSKYKVEIVGAGPSLKLTPH